MVEAICIIGICLIIAGKLASGDVKQTNPKIQLLQLESLEKSKGRL